jgi:hypothetical protein
VGRGVMTKKIVPLGLRVGSLAKNINKIEKKLKEGFI